MHLVRELLGDLGIAPLLEEEVVAELAGHLEDVRVTSLRSGRPEAEAVAKALEEVPNWVALNQEISAAKGGPMRERTMQLWLPGLAMLISSAVLQMLLLKMIPPTSWVQPKVPLLIGGSWLLVYLAIGALGANWSRQAGGDIITRFLAGIFPVALHLAIFISVLIAMSLQDIPRSPEYLQVSFQLKVFVSFVVLPGIAHAAGTLPFLSNRPSESAPSRA